MQIVNFLVLIWIMNMVLYKPIRKILLDRKEKVTGLQSDIDGSAEQVKSKKTPTPTASASPAAGQKQKEALMEAAAQEEKVIIGKINESAQAELKESESEDRAGDGHRKSSTGRRNRRIRRCDWTKNIGEGCLMKVPFSSKKRSLKARRMLPLALAALLLFGGTVALRGLRRRAR